MIWQLCYSRNSQLFNYCIYHKKVIMSTDFPHNPPFSPFFLYCYMHASIYIHIYTFTNICIYYLMAKQRNYIKFKQKKKIHITTTLIRKLSLVNHIKYFRALQFLGTYAYLVELELRHTKQFNLVHKIYAPKYQLSQVKYPICISFCI